MQAMMRWAGLICASLCDMASAGPGVWTTNGPEGGVVNHLAADPAAVDTLIAATRGGVFRSIDAGSSWQRFEPGLSYSFPYALEMASGSSTAYLAPDATTLFRSQSGGDWMPTALALGSGAYLTDLSLRPGSGQFLAASSSVGLQLSSDSGATFVTPVAAGLPPDDVLRLEYASATRLYAAFGQVPAGEASQVFRSDDGGASWTATAALPDPFVFLSYLDGDLEAAPSDPQRVYFSTGGAIYVSSDGGTSWGTCGAGAPAGGQVVIESGDADRIWVTGIGGVHSSIDGCASWTAHGTGLSSDGTRIDTSAALALAPTFPGDMRLWVGSVAGGVFRSLDAGASFGAVNTGLVSSHIRAIAMHPVDSSRILLGFGDVFDPSPTLYRSSDGGATWARSNSGLAATQVRGIAIDPTTAAAAGSTHIYAVGSSRLNGVTPSPSTVDGGIYKSVDGGTTWSTIDNGLPATYFGTRYVGTVRSVVLDPRSCASPPVSGHCTSGPLQTLYVTASGRANSATGAYEAARIYKSTNAGANWSASETGLPAASVAAGACFFNQIAVPLVIDPQDTDTLYVGLSVNYGSDPGCALPTVANGVFKSTDGGANWIHASNGLPRLGGAGSSHWNVLALAIDPSDTQTLYAGAYEPVATGFSGRVLKSVDGGATWSDSSVGIAGQDVRALLVDPADSNVIYAGTGGSPVNPSGIYKSTDGGLTWNSFSIGLPADAATALALDPHDPARLLAGTPGGLWELTQVPDGDSDGASTAVENAAPNAGDADGNGTPDALESDVASFFGVGSARPGDGLHGAVLPAVTLRVTPLLGNCARINNAHALPGSSLPADIARGVAPSLFDRGVLRFELPDCRRAQVMVIFHGADFSDADWTWRNYGPLTPGDAASMAWYGFESARKTGAGTWELVIDAAARGNYRDAQSDILFVGAPGFVDLAVFADSFE